MVKLEKIDFFYKAKEIKILDLYNALQFIRDMLLYIHKSI